MEFYCPRCSSLYTEKKEKIYHCFSCGFWYDEDNPTRYELDNPDDSKIGPRFTNIRESNWSKSPEYRREYMRRLRERQRMAKQSQTSAFA